MKTTTLGCTFQPKPGKPQSTTAYTYRVPTAFQSTGFTVGDLCVVSVRNRLEVVTVAILNPPLDPNADFDYKSITGIVLVMAND